MEPTSGQCGVQPSLLLLVITLLVTGVATGLLCSALISDDWEFVVWDRPKMDKIAKILPTKERIDWFMDGQIGRVNLSGKIREPFGLVQSVMKPSMFFVSTYSGLWTTCVTATDGDLTFLKEIDFPLEKCSSYLTTDIDKDRTDWQHRMQNLSISCALVCLIILGFSALVGTFGLIRQEISAVLVTGVMYLLAATFAFFTLAIVHLKRAQTEPDPECLRNQTTLGLKCGGIVLSTAAARFPFIIGSAADYLQARTATTGWRMQLGWAGVPTCLLVSILWILLSKMMRFYPISSLLNTLTVL